MGGFVRAAAFMLAGIFLWNGCSRQGEQPVNRALKAAVGGEWNKADKPSEEALKKTPDNVNALILRALVCERLGRRDEAVENARKAALIDSNSFTPLYTLGRLYAADPSRINDAVNLLIKANRLRPEHEGTLVLLCNLHLPGRKYSYLSALSKLPGWEKKPELVFESCLDRVYRRDRKGVNETLTRLLDENPRNPGLIYAVGGYFFRCGEARMRPKALEAYRLYLKFPEKQRTPERTASAMRRLAGR